MKLEFDEKWAKIEDRIRWCCVGRHGAIVNISKEESREISQILTHFFGGKVNHGQWWRQNKDHRQMMDVEFTHMTKVFPPPKDPWGWCGKTILFEDLKRIIYARAELAKLFQIEIISNKGSQEE